jgi:hypothetical protein
MRREQRPATWLAMNVALALVYAAAITLPLNAATNRLDRILV